MLVHIKKNIIFYVTFAPIEKLTQKSIDAILSQVLTVLALKKSSYLHCARCHYRPSWLNLLRFCFRNRTVSDIDSGCYEPSLSCRTKLRLCFKVVDFIVLRYGRNRHHTVVAELDCAEIRSTSHLCYNDLMSKIQM